MHSRHRGPGEGVNMQCTVDIDVPVRNKHTVYSRWRVVVKEGVNTSRLTFDPLPSPSTNSTASHSRRGCLRNPQA